MEAKKFNPKSLLTATVKILWEEQKQNRFFGARLLPVTVTVRNYCVRRRPCKRRMNLGPLIRNPRSLYDLAACTVKCLEQYTKDSLGRTPLYSALESASYYTAKPILWVVGLEDANYCFPYEKSKLKNKRYSILHLIVRNGNTKALNFFIKLGGNVNIIDCYEYSALHWASSIGNIEIVNILVRNSTLVDVKDFRSRTPLLLAALHKHNEVAEILLENGAYVNEIDYMGRNALYWAIGSKNLQLAQLFLRFGVNINQRDIMGRTVLYWAARCGFLEIIEILLDHGAVVNDKDEAGDTPIQWAAACGHNDILELLRNRNAS